MANRPQFFNVLQDARANGTFYSYMTSQYISAVSAFDAGEAVARANGYDMSGDGVTARERAIEITYLQNCLTEAASLSLTPGTNGGDLRCPGQICIDRLASLGVRGARLAAT